jgi:hypothetical protein
MIGALHFSQGITHDSNEVSQVRFTMTSTLFLLGTVLLAALVLTVARSYLPAGTVRIVLVALPLWLIYVGLLSWTGILANSALRPPGMAFVAAPVLAFMALFAVRSPHGAEVAARVPLALLTGAQVFRVAVELGLHRLSTEGLVPRLMTYEGGNVDIVIGLSAPIAAWLATRGPTGRSLVLGWNVLGLLALLNVIVRSALTAPGALHLINVEVPNLAVGTFPYSFIAGFFAPLAVLLHVLSLRRLLVLRTETPANPDAAQVH